MGCPSWAKDCRHLRPASGSTSGASSTPVTWRITLDRARKPVQTQGLARVVTDTVTTLAGEGGAVATPGAHEALRPESHARAHRGGAALPTRGGRPAPLRARGSRELPRRCALPVAPIKRARHGSWGRGSAASRTRPIALSGGLRRRRATHVSQAQVLLWCFALPYTTGSGSYPA